MSRTARAPSLGAAQARRVPPAPRARRAAPRIERERAGPDAQEAPARTVLLVDGLLLPVHAQRGRRRLALGPGERRRGGGVAAPALLQAVGRPAHARRARGAAGAPHDALVEEHLVLRCVDEAAAGARGVPLLRPALAQEARGLLAAVLVHRRGTRARGEEVEAGLAQRGVSAGKSTGKSTGKSAGDAGRRRSAGGAGRGRRSVGGNGAGVSGRTRGRRRSRQRGGKTRRKRGGKADRRGRGDSGRTGGGRRSRTTGRHARRETSGATGREAGRLGRFGHRLGGRGGGGAVGVALRGGERERERTGAA